MIRMEVACLLTLIFMSVVFFSVERERGQLDKLFSVLLITTMVHIVFDGITLMTVNNMDKVPGWLNDIMHRVFLVSLVSVCYMIYCYMVLLIEQESGKKSGISKISFALLLIFAVTAMFLPIEYIENRVTNYSFGPAVYTTYASVYLFLIWAAVLFIKNRNKMYRRTRFAVGLALSIFVFVATYQAIRPVSLISSMGFTLIILSFYLGLENPDIYLARQKEKEKEIAEKANASKSVFISNMSHELRTLMNANVGMADILLGTELTNEQREYLNNIRNAGGAVISIINDLLDVSKIEAGRMELVEDEYELKELVEDVRVIIENRIADKDMELIVDIDQDIPKALYGDELRIKQILINLMNNAVKYTDKGSVKLKITKLTEADDRVSLFVSVADTGLGIKKEDLEHLFDAFQRVDLKVNKGKEGTGLGLSICSNLVAMMGGNLQVKSEYGVGSEFFFTINQLVVATPQDKRKKRDTLDFIAPKARILIVDDNDMNRKVAVGLLAPLRAKVDVACSGEEAVEMVKRDMYNIIFMDHMMPGMDGIETTQCIRAMKGDYYKRVPIIALTANVMKGVGSLYKEADMNGFVSKPIDIRLMKKVLYKWLPGEYIMTQWEHELSEDILSVSDMDDEDIQGLYNIQGISATDGIKNSGGIEMFVSNLGDFYKLIDVKTKKVNQCIDDDQIREYTVEVHALKSMARIIGALKLSEDFYRLEKLGNAKDYDNILKETPSVLNFFQTYKDNLRDYAEKQMQEKQKVDKDDLIMYLEGIVEAVEGFDLDAADSAMSVLEECMLPEECHQLMEELRVYFADVAMEEIVSVAKHMIDIVSTTEM